MSLFIGNLSSRIRERDLEAAFSRFGRNHVEIKDGYGFVVFEATRDAERALNALRGRKICGERASISWAKKQMPFRNFSADRKEHEGFHSRSRYSRGRESRDTDERAGNEKNGSNGKEEFEMEGDLQDKEDRTEENNNGDDGGSMHDLRDKEDVNERDEQDAGEDDFGNRDMNIDIEDRYVAKEASIEKEDTGERMRRRKHSKSRSYGSSAKEDSRGRDERGKEHEENKDKRETRPQAKLQDGCFKCGQVGHIMRNCRAWDRRNASDRDRSGREYDRSLRTRATRTGRISRDGGDGLKRNFRGWNEKIAGRRFVGSQRDRGRFQRQQRSSRFLNYRNFQGQRDKRQEWHNACQPDKREHRKEGRKKEKHRPRKGSRSRSVSSERKRRSALSRSHSRSHSRSRSSSPHLQGSPSLSSKSPSKSLEHSHTSGSKATRSQGSHSTSFSSKLSAKSHSSADKSGSQSPSGSKSKSPKLRSKSPLSNSITSGSVSSRSRSPNQKSSRSASLKSRSGSRSRSPASCSLSPKRGRSKSFSSQSNKVGLTQHGGDKIKSCSPICDVKTTESEDYNDLDKSINTATKEKAISHTHHPADQQVIEPSTVQQAKAFSIFHQRPSSPERIAKKQKTDLLLQDRDQAKDIEESKNHNKWVNDNRNIVLKIEKQENKHVLHEDRNVSMESARLEAAKLRGMSKQNGGHCGTNRTGERGWQNMQSQGDVLAVTCGKEGARAPNDAELLKFGASRLCPWPVIYVRRVNRGPVSDANYELRKKQNEGFGIIDARKRSSSGWWEQDLKGIWQ